MIPPEALAKIKVWAIYHDWFVAFDGKSAGNRHLFRTRTIASYLSKEEGGRGDVVEGGAWLHDIGLIRGDNAHETSGIAIAGEFLASIDLNPKDISAVTACIRSHEGKPAPTSLEAKIVHDADALDKSGLLGLIRHAWKLLNNQNNEISPKELTPRLRDHLTVRKEKISTATAKRLSGHIEKTATCVAGNTSLLTHLLSETIRLVRQNKTSDEIAEQLILNKGGEVGRVLKYQLECQYLKG